MESYLLWAIAGILLIITELMTGTLYLLVIGVAALAGAGAAWLKYSFWIQTVIAAAVAVIGVIAVSRMRATQPAAPNQQLDIGQSVLLDSWVSEADGLARVTYRNAQWDAKVVGERGPAAGKLYYICGVDGSTLRISATKPAQI